LKLPPEGWIAMKTDRLEGEETLNIVITLVHGTWGRLLPSRTPRWFEPGSEFRRQLEAHLAGKASILIRESCWSGKNAIKARSDASTVLAQELAQLEKVQPQFKQVIIGHSHGGNVALDALRSMELNSNVHLLITMATPFLEIGSLQPRSGIMRAVHALIYSLSLSLIGGLIALLFPSNLKTALELDDQSIGISLFISEWMLISLKFIVYGAAKLPNRDVESAKMLFPILVGSVNR
jgi:hypothetical protein